MVSQSMIDLGLFDFRVVINACFFNLVQIINLMCFNSDQFLCQKFLHYSNTRIYVDCRVCI